MVVDTSALLAILFAEPEAERLLGALATAPRRLVGAPTLVEAGAVLLARKGPQGGVALDALLQRLSLEVVPMNAAAAGAGRAAHARYGRGVGSPGVLNFGDCLAYGVASALGEPLLCTGEDFSQTDAVLAEY